MASHVARVVQILVTYGSDSSSSAVSMVNSAGAPSQAMAEAAQRLDWRLHGRLRHQIPPDLDDQGGVPTPRGIHGAGEVHLRGECEWRLGAAAVIFCCGILYRRISFIIFDIYLILSVGLGQTWDEISLDFVNFCASNCSC